MDPIPKQTIDKDNDTGPDDHSISPAFTQENSRAYDHLAADNDRYIALDDETKEVWDEEDRTAIEKAFESRTTDELLEALRTLREKGNHASTSDTGELPWAPVEATPIGALSLVDDGSRLAITGPAQFDKLPKKVQDIYVLSTRAQAMGMLLSGSSYDSALFYGKLPSRTLQKEAIRYNEIVNEISPGLIEEAEAANEVEPLITNIPRIGIDDDERGLLLPGDLSALIARAQGRVDSEKARIFHEQAKEIAYRYVGEALYELLGENPEVSVE